MANVITSYFFPPQWNFERGGAIGLGNIISDPKTPQYALNEDDRQPLPHLIVDHRKPQFKAIITVDSTQSVGIGSSLLSLFGFGVDVTAERSMKRVYEVEAQELLTQEINPQRSYVEACFKHENITEYLERTKYRKGLYMIVGIMAATSATVSSDIGRKYLFEEKVGVNLAPAVGVPVGIEARASNATGKETQASFGKSDFILGYRLKKITYMKTKRLKDIQDVVKGTVLDQGGQSQSAETVNEARFIRLEEKEIGSDEFQLASVTAEDESAGEKFEFVITKDE